MHQSVVDTFQLLLIVKFNQQRSCMPFRPRTDPHLRPFTLSRLCEGQMSAQFLFTLSSIRKGQRLRVN